MCLNRCTSEVWMLFAYLHKMQLIGLIDWYEFHGTHFMEWSPLNFLFVCYARRQQESLPGFFLLAKGSWLTAVGYDCFLWGVLGPPGFRHSVWLVAFWELTLLAYIFVQRHTIQHVHILFRALLFQNISVGHAYAHIPQSVS